MSIQSWAELTVKKRLMACLLLASPATRCVFMRVQQVSKQLHTFRWAQTRCEKAFWPTCLVCPPAHSPMLNFRTHFLPAVLGLRRQVCCGMPVCTEVVARLLRSTTDGVGAAGGVGGVACCGGGAAVCGAWSLWAVLAGMPFSDRNSSRSMYSSWKLSASYGRVLSHRVGPRKADCGWLAALLSSSSFFPLSLSFPNPANSHRQSLHCLCSSSRSSSRASWVIACNINKAGWGPHHRSIPSRGHWVLNLKPDSLFSEHFCCVICIKL